MAKSPSKKRSPAPSKSAPRPKAKPAAKKAVRSAKPSAAPRPPAKGSGSKRPSGSAAKSSAPPMPELPPPPPIILGDGRRHLLSLSFLRDGDEFLARLETDSGQITEMKNRSLDQLLTLVAGELEDLLP
ncbi:MAG TPA: hypothetical protein VGV89_04980 [Thermoplasmata archaeon]|nr:hypothetical protein [Thermoplasmata archaeon]